MRYLPITILEVLRRKQGLTAGDLARRAGYGRCILSPIENRRTVAWKKLQHKLAGVLGVEPVEIFDEKGFAKIWDY